MCEVLQELLFDGVVDLGQEAVEPAGAPHLLNHGPGTAVPPAQFGKENPKILKKNGRYTDVVEETWSMHGHHNIRKV